MRKRIKGTELVTLLEALTELDVEFVYETSDDGRIIIRFSDLAAQLIPPSALGRLLAQYSWPAGDTQTVEGTFTAGAAGADPGVVYVTPATDDEFIVMYGRLLIGGTKVGAGATGVEIWNAGGDFLARLAYLSAGTVGQWLWFPGLGQDAAASGRRPSLRPDLGLMVSGTDSLIFKCYNMANAETFDVDLRIRSRLKTAPTVTASANGTWA